MAEREYGESNMTERPYREVPLSSTDLELDKTLAGWVLTAWPPTIAPAVLRLRIPEYLNSADPFPVVYEMRSPGATESGPWPRRRYGPLSCSP